MTHQTQIVAALQSVSSVILQNQQLLCDLDAHQGDGDHGISMSKTFRAVAEKLTLEPSLEAKAALELVGMTVLTEVGGAMGPLFGSAFLDASKALDASCSPRSVAEAIRAGSDAIAKRGGAVLGDKTMLDATIPAFEAALNNTESIQAVLSAAARAAVAGAENTVDMVAKRGRGARLGDRSRGAADAGATSVSLILSTLAEHYSKEDSK